MKKTFALILFVFFLSILGCSSMCVAQTHMEGSASLRIETAKPTFVLGEIVPIKITIKNISSQTIEVPSSDVWSGSLKILISEKGSNEGYKVYTGPGWGMLCTQYELIKLQPEEQIQMIEDVLWNDTRGSNAADDTARDKITTHYAFPKAQTYSVKATMGYSDPIESEPIDITTISPEGADLVIWDEMNKNHMLGAFLHEKRYAFVHGITQVELNALTKKINHDRNNSDSLPVLARQMLSTIKKNR